MEHTLQDFFDSVLPSHGLLCVVGLMHDKSKPPIVQYFTQGDPESHAVISRLDADGREVYYGCASYADETKPKNVANVQQLKTFYVDIDCGKNGCYENKRQALEELVRFCNELYLPSPTIVDSGNGIHAYWRLTHSIDYNAWKPIADALKKKAVEKEFKIDPSVTGDGARILRVPFTRNQKRADKIRNVKLIRIGEPLSLEDFKSHIGYLALGANQNPDKDPVMEALLRNSRSWKFSRIHRKNIDTITSTESVEEEYMMPNNVKAIRLVKKKVTRSKGCPQLAYCVANRATLKNPMWMAALSIAWYCTDQAEGVEAVSKDHEDYDFDNSCYQASRMLGPRTCKEFRAVSEHPYLCDTCIHNGKINTPIVLGATIEEAAPDDNIIEVMHEVLGEKQEIEIPSTYPFPFFRPKNGGVAVRVTTDTDSEDEDDATEEKAVCARDMWVKSRSRDGQTEMATIALRLPHDGLIEFTAPLPILYKTESLRDLLAAKGVHEAASDTKLKLIKLYLSAWTKKLQDEGKANAARTQFGWQDNDTVFVLGNREIDRNGKVQVSTTAHSIESVARLYVKQGSLEEWQKVANLYGRPGNEARAFSLFCSFGAALYKFIGEGSTLLHLTNVASGVGKSTVQKVANSVWGSPTEAMVIEDDTPNAKIHRAGILNNIPMMIDEITNMAPDKASPLAFTLSQGRGKNRMMSSANSERINTTTWSSIFQTSGNNSLYDTIRLHKQSVEGELLRIFEVPIPLDKSMTKEEADDIFTRTLPYNYGHAGELFLRYVVPNLDATLDRLKAVHIEYDKQLNMSSTERFYSSTFAAAFTAAEIANRIGIIDIPIEPVKKWAQAHMDIVRKAVKKGAFSMNPRDYTRYVSQYWNSIIAQVLTVHKGADPVDTALMDKNQAALKPVIGALKGRYEVVNGMLYVAAHEFDSWMALNRIPSIQVLNGLRQIGALVFEGEFNLGQDTVIYKTGAVMAYGFDTDMLELPSKPRV